MKEKTLKYIGIAAIVLLLVGLSGWYFFLKNQTADIEGDSAARGFSIGIPSFLGGKSSTAQNSEAAAAEKGTASGAETNSSGSAFARFLGIGSSVGEGIRAIIPGGEQPAEKAERKAPRLLRVSLAPVAGLTFISGTTTKFRYVERATGNVFEVDALTGDTTRITNTLTAKVYEAFLTKDTVVQRILSDEGKAVTLTGRISTTTEGGFAELKGSDLGVDARSIALYATSSDLLMLVPSGTNTHLIRSRWNGASPKQLLSIPAGEFRIMPPVDSGILLVEKAASGIAGSAFDAGARLVPLLQNIPGLTAIRHASGALLYSSDDGARLRLFVRPPNAVAAEISLTTIAEKCTWASSSKIYCAVPQDAPPARFLDGWYRGEIHTADSWYTIDVGAAKAERFFTMDGGRAIDVESPMMDVGGNYIAFTDARDKSLWLLRIKE